VSLCFLLLHTRFLHSSSPLIFTGVLLLNATLTVRASQANSHAGKGWEAFTDAIIDVLNKQKSGLVFLLWGSYAQKKGARIDQKKHHVLKTVHPSGLSASKGFFGCKHFSKTNEFLKKNGTAPIDWQVE
jgi:uracil-DNA glycosylase